MVHILLRRKMQWSLNNENKDVEEIHLRQGVVLSQYLRREVKNKNEEQVSGEPVSGPRFEARNCHGLTSRNAAHSMANIDPNA